jgi:hypothetical protein
MRGRLNSADSDGQRILDVAVEPQNFQDQNMKKSDASPSLPASELISQRIADLADWRGEALGRMRKLIKETDPEVVEEWKWMGTPVWSRDGIIAVANTHKGKVKVTFDYGARLPDPDKLFNAGLEGNQRRAIDFFEGDKVNERALKALVRAAIEFNQSKAKKKPAPKSKKK